MKLSDIRSLQTSLFPPPVMPARVQGADEPCSASPLHRFTATSPSNSAEVLQRCWRWMMMSHDSRHSGVQVKGQTRGYTRLMEGLNSVSGTSFLSGDFSFEVAHYSIFLQSWVHCFCTSLCFDVATPAFDVTAYRRTSLSL